MTKYLDTSAHISECGKYRYWLSRVWDNNLPEVMFIGLNPSTADATEDDPTIRRCVGFAKAWGFGGLRMTNLFAFRATQPLDMVRAPDPIGPLNHEALVNNARQTRVIVAAWGTLGYFMGQGDRVRAQFADRIQVLRLTKDGHPSHPLYLPKTLTPQDWK